jgi:hypothetical protein
MVYNHRDWGTSSHKTNITMYFGCRFSDFRAYLIKKGSVAKIVYSSVNWSCWKLSYVFVIRSDVFLGISRKSWTYFVDFVKNSVKISYCYSAKINCIYFWLNLCSKYLESLSIYAIYSHILVQRNQWQFLNKIKLLNHWRI